MSATIEYGNLFSGTKYDAPEEIYLLTMDRMDDKTLLTYCQTSPYVARLCRDDNFWLRRIQQRELSALLPYRSLYKDLREFYINVRKDAVYIVSNSSLSSFRAFNNPTRARKHLDDVLRKRHGITAVELDYETLGSLNPYFIMIAFMHRIITDIKDYVVFSIDKSNPKYLNDITGYPELMFSNYIIHSHTINHDWDTQTILDEKHIYLPLTDSNMRFFEQQFIIMNGAQGTSMLLAFKADDIHPTQLWIFHRLGVVVYIEDDQALTIGILFITDVKGANGKTTGKIIVALNKTVWENYFEEIVLGLPQANVNDERFLRDILAAGMIFPLNKLQSALDYLYNNI